MKVMLDCDVLLDVLLDRAPHRTASATVLDWASQQPGRACVAWHTLANLIYIVEGDTDRFIRELLRFVDIPRTGTADMHFALSLPMNDHEDAMQVAAAVAAGASTIITRNTRDYQNAPIPALTPSDFLSHPPA